MGKTTIQGKLITEILRDNPVVNAVFRNILRLVQPWSRHVTRLTNRYRVYGTVALELEGISFRIYAEGDDFIANDIYYDHPYEREEFMLVKALTAHSKHFVDIGSNTGIFSIFAAKVNPEIKVLSFEPHPGNFERIEVNVRVNQTTNVRSFPLALGDTESVIKFTIPADGSLATTSSANEAFTRNFHDLPYETIDVRQTTLDKILSEYPITAQDLIKIDVEYYEVNVLKGMHTVLSEVKPPLLLEVLQYEKLVAQFSGMQGKINREHGLQIEGILAGYGYFPYQLSRGGVRRIESTLTSEGARNFLFIPVKASGGVIPFEDLGKFILGITRLDS